MKTFSLSQLIERLQSSPRVRGVFVTGSTGTDAKPWSDIDLVVIVDTNPEGLKSIYTRIDGKFADIFFFDTKFIQDVIAATKIPGLDMRGMLVTWLEKATIEYDPDGILQNAQDTFRKAPPRLTVTEQEQRDLWVKINYNFIANSRYYKAQDPIYHWALAIRLSYSVVELLTAYFSFRGIPWRGEKVAVEYLASHDDDYLQTLLRSSSASELQEKMAAYQALFAKTLHNDFQAWGEEFIVPQTEDGKYNPTLRSFWEGIVEQPVSL